VGSSVHGSCWRRTATCADSPVRAHGPSGRSFLKQVGIFDRDRRLVGDGLHEADGGLEEFAQVAPLQERRAKWTLGSGQRTDEGCAQAHFEYRIAQRITRALGDVRDLQRLTLVDRLAQACFPD
jgi:hypothetical protein